jgi:hypothetical protein
MLSAILITVGLLSGVLANGDQGQQNWMTRHMQGMDPVLDRFAEIKESHPKRSGGALFVLPSTLTSHSSRP